MKKILIIGAGIAGLGGAPCLIIASVEGGDVEIIHFVAIGGETQSFQQQDLLSIHPDLHLAVIGLSVCVDLDTLRYMVPFATFENNRRTIRIEKIMVLPVFIRLIHVVEIEHRLAARSPHQACGETVRSVAQIASGAAGATA